MMRLSFSNKGFTLIELILYVFISALILSGVIGFLWNVMGGGVKVRVGTELLQNARLVNERITQHVKSADGIVLGSSTFGVHPGILTLDLAGVGTDVVIDTYTKSVTVGGQPFTIRKLRLKEGAAAAIDLTSDRLNVTDFQLTNLTRGLKPPVIRWQFTLDYAQSANDELYDRSLSIQSSATIRKK